MMISLPCLISLFILLCKRADVVTASHDEKPTPKAIDEFEHLADNNVIKDDRTKLVTYYLEDFVKDDQVKERVLSRHLKGAKAGKGSTVVPTRLREPSPSVCECEKGVSEEDCQKRKIAVEKQLLQIFALQEELEQFGVEPIDYDNAKYLDLQCIAQANAVQIAYLKQQNTNHALATTDSDCNESARKNFCTSNCNEITVLFGRGCKERETPRDTTICLLQAAQFNGEVTAVLKQQLQITSLEKNSLAVLVVIFVSLQANQLLCHRVCCNFRIF